MPELIIIILCLITLWFVDGIVNDVYKLRKLSYDEGYNDGYQAAVEWINERLDDVIKKQEIELARSKERLKDNGIL